MNEDAKLSARTRAAIIIEAGLNAIPCVGGSLATLYFGTKDEQRFQRLETFYLELKAEVEKKMSELTPLAKHDPAALAEIIEEINEAVQADFTERKRNYFKRCFLSALRENNEGKSDKRRYFVSTLRVLTHLQIDILVKLHGAQVGTGYRFASKEEEGAADFNASLESLRSMGLLEACLNATIRPGINWGEITLYSLSSFGREFTDFCLHDA